jgi:large subunit ribosomal protein L13
MQKTYLPTEKDIKRKWYLIDANGKILGRVASRIAVLLRGKHKSIFTRHMDTGDGVIVINAEKI